MKCYFSSFVLPVVSGLLYSFPWCGSNDYIYGGKTVIK